MMFIDGSNLFWACKGFRDGFKIEYGKLRDEVVGNRKLVRPYFYSAVGVPPTPDQIGFHDSLRFQGFTVITRPLKVRQSGAIEKGVD